MAGQPQEPSWQPGGQDQARAAWPQPTFTPPAGSTQDTFAFAQPAYGQPGPPGQPGQPGQGYPPPTYIAQDPAQAYGGQDQAQAYIPQDQGQAYIPQDQGQAAYNPQDPGQAYNPQAQGMPQWQAAPGMPRSAPSRQRGERGFVGSLFDFSFNSMVTPKIVKMLYILLTAFVGLWALIFTVFCFERAGVVAGFFVLIVLDPIYVLLTLGVYRVVLEFVMVTFRLHEDVKAIRAKGEGQG